MENFSLSGKVAVVTGAGGKLGKIWVYALADAGACVVATDLGDKPSEPLMQLIDKYKATDSHPGKAPDSRPAKTTDSHPGKVEYCGGVDIMKREDALRLCDFCKKTFGTADILVNNAGIDQPPSADGSHYTIEGYPEELFRRILDVNTFGAFNMAQIFGDEMKKASARHLSGDGRTGADVHRPGGSIINIGSLYSGVSPDEKFYTHLANESGSFIKPPSYGMSKAALVNLTKYLAAHWGKYGIRVNTLSPGGVEGGQDPEFKRKFCDRVPLGRMAQPEDLMGALVFLASDASRYVTGVELKVDGGFTAW